MDQRPTPPIDFALRCCHWLLNIAGLAVPRRRRTEWRREWWAELSSTAPRSRTARRRSGRSLRLIGRAAGGFLDAAALGISGLRRALRHEGRTTAALLTKPVLCATTIAAPAVPLALASAALALMPTLLAAPYDDGLAEGTATFGLLLLIAGFGAAVGTRAGLRQRRADRRTVAWAWLAVGLLTAPVAGSLWASTVGWVGQDPVPHPRTSVVAIVAGLATASAASLRGLRPMGPASPLAIALRRGSVWSGVVALATAMVLFASWGAELATDLGFQAGGLYTLRITLTPASGHDAAALVSALRAEPAIRAAAITDLAPLSRSGNRLVDLRATWGPAGLGSAVVRRIGPGYFDTLGADAPVATTGALVSPALAARLGGVSAVGQHVLADGHPWPIGGVAPALQHFDPGDDPAAVLYLPMNVGVTAFDLLLRPSHDTGATPMALERLVRAHVLGATVSAAVPLTSLLYSRLAWKATGAAMFGLLAVCSFGVALSVSPRRKGHHYVVSESMHGPLNRRTQ